MLAANGNRSSHDALTDPALRSWVSVSPESDFPIQNLPYAAAREPSGATHLYVAVGDHALDLAAVASGGLLDGIAPHAREMFCAPTLGALLAAGRAAWRASRTRLSELLREGNRELADAGLERALVERASLDFALAMDVPDYIDFYSSLEHASNVGRIFRPNDAPLLENWRYVPIGYHGRTSTLIPGGTPVARPRGQIKPGDAPPVYAPTRRLDFELEMAFVTGDGPPGGISIAGARENIFGMCILNDWSARDVQTWEYRPLGPFLAKSFATTLSPWIVTLDALEPFRVAGPVQDPAPLEYLRPNDDGAYDIALEVALSSARMREENLAARSITRTTFRTMYWSIAQQLAHAASNGARIRAGDLFGSGTISGSEPDSFGSLLELSWGGTRPIALPDGTTRTYLEDGDEVVMRAWCEGSRERARIGFGELRGRVAPPVRRQP